MHAYAVYIWNYLDISTSLISQEISPLSFIVPPKMMKSPFVALGSIRHISIAGLQCLHLETSTIGDAQRGVSNMASWRIQ